MNPSVSIITTVYNTAPYIADTTRSVLEQQDVDIEWLVIDDASNDGSLDVMIQTLDGGLPPNVSLNILRHETNVGQKGEYMSGLTQIYAEGVALTRAPHFKILDSDDVLAHPHALRDQANFLARHPQVAASFSRSVHMDRNGNPLRNAGWFLAQDEGVVNAHIVALNHMFHIRYPFTHAGMMYNRAVAQAVWSANGRMSFDNEFLRDALRLDQSIGYQNREIARFRRRPDSYSNSREAMGAHFDELQREVGRVTIGELTGKSAVAYRHSVKWMQNTRDRVRGRSTEF